MITFLVGAMAMTSFIGVYFVVGLLMYKLVRSFKKRKEEAVLVFIFGPGLVLALVSMAYGFGLVILGE